MKHTILTIAKVISRRRVLRLICLLGVDGLIFGETNPDSSRAFMLIVGFLLFSATIYCLLDGALAVIRLYGLSIKHPRRLQAFLTALSAGLVALQSIGQLSSRDVGVVSVLAVLLYLYVAHAKTPRQQFDVQQT